MNSNGRRVDRYDHPARVEDWEKNSVPSYENITIRRKRAEIPNVALRSERSRPHPPLIGRITYQRLHSSLFTAAFGRGI